MNHKREYHKQCTGIGALDKPPLRWLSNKGKGEKKNITLRKVRICLYQSYIAYVERNVMSICMKYVAWNNIVDMFELGYLKESK